MSRAGPSRCGHGHRIPAPIALGIFFLLFFCAPCFLFSLSSRPHAPAALILSHEAEAGDCPGPAHSLGQDRTIGLCERPSEILFEGAVSINSWFAIRAPPLVMRCYARAAAWKTMGEAKSVPALHTGRRPACKFLARAVRPYTRRNAGTPYSPCRAL